MFTWTIEKHKKLVARLFLLGWIAHAKQAREELEVRKKSLHVPKGKDRRDVEEAELNQLLGEECDRLHHRVIKYGDYRRFSQRLCELRTYGPGGSGEVHRRTQVSILRRARSGMFQAGASSRSQQAGVEGDRVV